MEKRPDSRMPPGIFIYALSLLLFSVSAPSVLEAQTLPKEDAILNYRIIGFSFPAESGVVKYKLEIASGICIREDSFNKKIINVVTGKKNRLIAEVPAFGNSYTWRTISTIGHSKVAKSALHHFSTRFAATIDTCNIRLRVLSTALKYKDAFVFVDATKTLYDMNGVPVWYLPVKRDINSKPSLLRDLKLSPQGTITFIRDNKAYEINYEGDTLWTAPDYGIVNGEDSEQYHHEFTRLANGHYMVMGNEHVQFGHKATSAPDSILSETQEKINPDSLVMVNERTPFGTLIEYDEKGNMVWSWHSSKYFSGSDVVNFIPQIRKRIIDVHENAFFFDERDSVIYVSFKNISRILKVKYPEGTVINWFGETFRPGVLPSGNGLFCDQHACKYSPGGYLYLFNNNVCKGDDALPTVVMIKENNKIPNSVSKIWEYQCTTDGVHINTSMEKTMERHRMRLEQRMQKQGGTESVARITTGGNVEELPDHSIFVCMNAQYGKMFIVNHDKKILWSAVPERWNSKKNEWYLNTQEYRASIISRKQLEQLIWNSAK